MEKGTPDKLRDGHNKQQLFIHQPLTVESSVTQ
jgi:hypothetical protein